VEVSAVSITKRELGSAVVFESLNAGVVAFYTQGVCYVNPVCTAGLKSSILTLMPDETKLEESLTQGQFLELLAQKTR
jgi:hypothetical protein